MKRIICVFAAVLLLTFAISVPAFADTASISVSKASVTVGSTVTVTVKYNATFAMYAIDASLTYNNAVLQYVSGGTNQGSTVKMVETLSGETSKGFTLTFKAIAPGSGSLAFSAKASGSGDGSASSGATIEVAAAQPSSNANLGSIKLSEGTLSPAFKQATTSYSAKVKYSTEKITISANAAVGDSTVTGAGTFNLKVGDNSFTLTVTAASGDKKSYTVVVRRMTEEETAAAIQEERDNNPSLIVVNGADYFLQSDLSGLGVIEGYTPSTTQRKGADISVLSDNAGKYTLFWATDANGENGAFYTADEQDEFTKVNTIRLNERLYIIEPFEQNINVDSHFSPGKYDMNGAEVDCYKYSDEDLSDFYIFNCYINGENDYYCFDAAQNTIQREPLFIVKEMETAAANQPKEGLMDKLSNLSTQAKIVLGLIAFAVILVLVLIVLLIVKAVNRNSEEPDLYDENMSFDLLYNTNTQENETDDEDVPEETLPESEEQSEPLGEAEPQPAEETQPDDTGGEPLDTDEFLDPDSDF